MTAYTNVAICKYLNLVILLHIFCFPNISAMHFIKYMHMHFWIA